MCVFAGAVTHETPPPSGCTQFLERVGEDFRAVAATRPGLIGPDPAMRLVGSHALAVEHELAKSLRWKFRTSDQMQLSLNVECTPRRRLGIDGRELARVHRDAGLLGSAGVDDAHLVFSVGCGHEFQAHHLVQGGLLASNLTAFAIDGMMTMLDLLQRYGRPTILEGVRSGVAAAPAGGGGSVSEQLRLAAERYLEDLIVEQWAGIDFGADLAFVDRQVSCGQIGIIDILARDRATDGLVVIELKRDQGDDEAFGQLSRYMGWVGENMHQPEGVNVAGIIIAAEITPRLEAAARTNQDVRLLEYGVGLQLRSGNEGPFKKGEA